MKILYQIPSLESVYAARFIYEWYKDAFLDEWHEILPLTSNDDLEKMLIEFEPNIYMYHINFYTIKFIDFKVLKKYRDQWLIVFCQIAPWIKQNEQFGWCLSTEINTIDLIQKWFAWDIFHHWMEQEEAVMVWFTENTWYPRHTILLAANTRLYYEDYSDKYKADISYVWSYLGDKKVFMNEHLLPLREKYVTRFYGSDRTLSDKVLGYVQKIWQYFNINPLKKVRSIKLWFEDERKVYSSSLISLNIHEEHQRRDWSDINERTFKILASGWFEITDNVRVLRKYFTPDELVIAENTQDWFEKIDYYIHNPEKRLAIIEAWRKKVLENHTYHHRVRQIIDLYNKFTK